MLFLYILLDIGATPGSVKALFLDLNSGITFDCTQWTIWCLGDRVQVSYNQGNLHTVLSHWPVALF